MRIHRRSAFQSLLAAAVPASAQTASRSATGVKFERIDLTPVIVPMKRGSTVSENYGAGFDRRLAEFDRYPKFIIEIQAGGLTGIGETSREVPAESVKRNAEWLRGKSFADLDFARPSLGMPDARTADGFEIAIFDLLGKSAGIPVCALLGGCHQNKVAVSYWTGQRTVDDMVEVCHRAVAGGFKNLKFKGRFGDTIHRQLEAAARAAPSLTFIIDFNSSYPDVASFLPVAHRMQGYPLTIEDPVPKRLDWFRELRRRTTIPFALTPSSPQQAFEAIRQEAADVFNNSIGSRGFVDLGYVAELAGIPMWHGSGVELGVRDMWFVHKAAATKSCTVPSDTLCYLREHDLLTRPFQPVDGFIDVPKSPGLGVDLDRDAVRKFRAS